MVQQAALHGSFSGAAEVLGYTQSAVSRQVAAMEAAVGAPLFERIARGVRPTESGAVLVEHAGAVLAEVASAETAITRIRERLEGRLTLGSIPVAMSVLVPRSIARLSRVNPGLEISLQEAHTPILVERARHGLVDVAVVAVGPELPDYDLDDLRRDALLVGSLKVAVPAGHRLARRDRVPVDELRDERWIVGEATGDEEPIFAAWPTLSEPRIAYAARDWPARLGMVAAGLGVAVLASIAEASVPAGVVALTVDDPAHEPRSAVALTLPDATDAARAMVAALRTEAAGIALGGRRARRRDR